MDEVVLDRIREGIWSLRQPFPSELESYTLSYLIADSSGALHVIDPGIGSDAGWDRLVRGLATIGCSVQDVATVTVTHAHPDHGGLAPRLAAASGARVAMHPADLAPIGPLADADTVTRWGVPHATVPDVLEHAASRAVAPGLVADVLLRDGDELDIPGRSIRVIHAPGHTPGHVCLHAAAEGLLFTGDHVLPNQVAGIGLGAPSADPVGDYFASLDRIAAIEGAEGCPGHGQRFADVPGRCAEIAAHHRRRSDEVARALAADPELTVWEIASGLTWTAGWQNLRGMHRASALAQTAMHAAHLRSRSD